MNLNFCLFWDKSLSMTCSHSIQSCRIFIVFLKTCLGSCPDICIGQCHLFHLVFTVVSEYFCTFEMQLFYQSMAGDEPNMYIDGSDIDMNSDEEYKRLGRLRWWSSASQALATVAWIFGGGGYRTWGIPGRMEVWWHLLPDIWLWACHLCMVKNWFWHIIFF